MVIWGGSEYDVRDYRNYWVKGKEGMQQNWYVDSWYDNPWFKAYEITDAYDIDVVNAALNASYEITPWLKAMVRSGVDVYTKRGMRSRFCSRLRRESRNTRRQSGC